MGSFYTSTHQYHCSLNGAGGDTLNIALPNMDLPEPPAPKLLTTFQRELNRATDSDRNTRKRGLQKLLEDVPWPKKSQREDLKVFVYQHLWKVVVPIVSDDVEKCRELSLQILKRCLEKCDDISIDLLQELVVRLCARIGELPFPEPAEEIRLLVVELMLMISRHAAFTASIVTNGPAVSSIDEMIVQALARGLTDAFPPVKRAGAELLVEIAARSPFTVRSHFKQVLKALQTNAGHQHSKTRSITLQAIGKGLACLGLEDYQTLFKEPILATFLRTVSDRTASVRIELGVVAAEIFEHRVKQCLERGCALLAEDFELIVIILLLHGDTIEEVSAEGRRQLIRAVHSWDPVLLCNDGEVNVPINSHLNASTAMDISDGELALQQHFNSATTETSASSEPKSATIDYNDVSKVRQYAAANMRSILPILQEGVESWTTDSRKRYLCGLDCYISYVDGSINAVLPRLFSIIALQVRDEDAEVRAAAEQCCVRLGYQASGEDMLEILLPRVAGAVPGGDTAAQRASAAGVLTHVLKGLRQRVDSMASSRDSVSSAQMPNMLYLCTTLATTLSETPLYGFREASLRESVLLLVRTLMECFPAECKDSAHIQQAVLLALTFLCGKCPGEDDVIPDIAHKVLERLSDIVDVTVDALLGMHYQFLLYHIVTFQLPTSVTSVVKIDVADVKNSPAMAHFYGELSLQWESDSVAMAAFNALVRAAPEATWKNFGLILPVVKKMVQPRAAPVAGSAEANALTYAAQRGEDVANPHVGLVDARLNLLALLEGLVRAGLMNWECSGYIATASEDIIRYMIVPNLVWRVGRVEATVRKVALALAYGILKAGAVKEQTLFATAGELVPLIVSHLDDSELTPRQMACLCVTVLFERLRGVFSEQSIHEIYPKLVARLDDSNDQVRVAICSALVMFFQCGAHPKCFSSTTIDYTLDQLFIHLDDPEPSIQHAVLSAIVQVAKTLDKSAVLKKAEKNRDCHRTPVMCDRVMFEVTGVEILSE